MYNGPIPQYDEIGVDFNDGAFQDSEAQLNFYLKLRALGYPIEKIYEKVLQLPEKEAMELAVSGLRQQADQTTGMFNRSGLPEELE